MRVDIQELKFIHPMLRDILVNLEKTTGVEFTITSIYRIDDTGVHGTLPVRGIGLRMRSSILGEEIHDGINDAYQYDPQRPKLKCCILHGEASNLHLHIQVHDRTRRI